MATISRRAFVAGTTTLLAAPLAAGAQQRGKPVRVGILLLTTVTPSSSVHHFRAGLRELGYVEGGNLLLEYREAEGKPERLPDLARELVEAKVDVIYASLGATALAAKQATNTVPVVFAAVPDPVAIGLVTSLARPGGNVTGVALEATPEQAAKQLELLKELAPSITRVGYFRDPELGASFSEPYKAVVERAQARLGLKVIPADVRSVADLDRALDALVRAQVDALWLVGFPAVFQGRGLIADFTLKSRLPAVAPFRQFAEAGGLASFGASLAHVHRRAATYVDKILKGARPADLPVEQPTTFELVVNLKAAKALGLTIPPSLLLRADQVIE